MLHVLAWCHRSDLAALGSVYEEIPEELLESLKQTLAHGWCDKSRCRLQSRIRSLGWVFSGPGGGLGLESTCGWVQERWFRHEPSQRHLEVA